MGLIDDLPTTGLGSRPHLEACLTLLEELVGEIRAQLWADEIGKAYAAGMVLKVETTAMQMFMRAVVQNYQRTSEVVTAILEYTPAPYAKMDAEWSPCE